VRLSTEQRIAWIQGQYDAAVAGGQTLLARLQSIRQTLAESVTTGQILASTSGQGYWVAFAPPGAGGPSQADILDVLAWAMRRYELAREELGQEASDAQVLASMISHASLGWRRGATAVSPDFGAMRQRL
jgi:hypothetical protein